MIASLAGWTRRAVANGVLLAAPDPLLGTISVRAGLPPRPVQEVVARLAAADGGVTYRPAQPPRHLLTVEGEHAVVVEPVGRSGDSELRRAIALVFGDHEMALFDGRAVRSEGWDIAAKVQSLASTFILGLGFDRWRPFFYRAPAGWNRLSRFHADIWLAPDYPKNPGTITVFWARPGEPRVPTTTFTHYFENIPAEFKRGDAPTRESFKAAAGLNGQSITYTTTFAESVRAATNVSLSDARMVHLLRLETDLAHAEANRAVFVSLVGSVEPVPSPPQKEEAFSQWSE